MLIDCKEIKFMLIVYLKFEPVIKSDMCTYTASSLIIGLKVSLPSAR